MLDKLTTNETETILLGEFNFNYIAPNTATMKFKRLTNLFHLKQLITEPTRITENSRSLIDLFLTSRPELYVSSVTPIGFSDHCAIAGFRKLHRIKLPPPRFVDVRNYKNYDPTLFKTDLHYVPWDILELANSSGAPDEEWNSFKDMFLTVVDKHAPIVTRRLTPEIKNLMREREYHHKKAIKTNNEVHCSRYKRLRNAVNLKLKYYKILFHSPL